MLTILGVKSFNIQNSEHKIHCFDGVAQEILL